MTPSKPVSSGYSRQTAVHMNSQQFDTMYKTLQVQARRNSTVQKKVGHEIDPVTSTISNC